MASDAGNTLGNAHLITCRQQNGFVARWTCCVQEQGLLKQDSTSTVHQTVCCFACSLRPICKFYVLRAAIWMHSSAITRDCVAMLGTSRGALLHVNPPSVYVFCRRDGVCGQSEQDARCRQFSAELCREQVGLLLQHKQLCHGFVMSAHS